MEYPYGWWKCTFNNGKFPFFYFRVGEYYLCKPDVTNSPRIYCSTTLGNDSLWAPYWQTELDKFCYEKDQLDFEYIGFNILKEKEMSTLELTCEQVEDIVKQALIAHLDMVEEVENDPNETRDNSSREISAFYTLIKYWMAPSEYQEWIKERKNV